MESNTVLRVKVAYMLVL